MNYTFEKLRDIIECFDPCMDNYLYVYDFTVLLYADRCIFRILSGEQGFKDGSHRCIAL